MATECKVDSFGNDYPAKVREENDPADDVVTFYQAECHRRSMQAEQAACYRWILENLPVVRVIALIEPKDFDSLVRKEAKDGK